MCGKPTGSVFDPELEQTKQTHIFCCSYLFILFLFIVASTTRELLAGALLMLGQRKQTNSEYLIVQGLSSRVEHKVNPFNFLSEIFGPDNQF